MSKLLTSAFVALLDENVDKITNDRSAFNELNGMVNRLCNVQSVDSNDYQSMTISGMPDIPAYYGGKTLLSIHPGFKTTFEPKEYAAQFHTDRKALDDLKGKNLPDIAGSLVDSFYRVTEKKLADVFNYCTSVSLDFMTREEGVSLASDSHLTKVPSVSTTSGFDNLGSDALSSSAFSTTRVLMKHFRQDNGEYFQATDEWGLIYPDELDDLANTIIGTQQGYDTPTGSLDKNMQYKRFKLFPYTLLSDVSSSSWGMVNLSAMKRHLQFLWRIKPESKTQVDWDTGSLMQSVYGRFAVGADSWRWLYWHNVT